MAYAFGGLCLLTLFICYVPCSYSFPDQGKWQFTAVDVAKQYFSVHKSLYKGSTISIKVSCTPSRETDNPSYIWVGWMLHTTPCFQEYFQQDNLTQGQLESLWDGGKLFDIGHLYFKAETEHVQCFDGIELTVQDISKIESRKGSNVDVHRPRKRRAVPELPSKEDVVDVAQGKGPGAATTASPTTKALKVHISGVTTAAPHVPGEVGIIPKDGVYMLIVSLRSVENRNFSARVDLSMKGSYGYLSAVDWPFLPFYGVMCGVYVIYAVGWLVVSAMQWRDLLRIQFWIGGVIFLGMLEKAVFYAEYQSINYTGYSVQGAVLFAEVLSSLKRSLARLLVIIVSLGFGIVKPRLGPMLHRVVIVGCLYFILAAVEGCIRTLRPKNAPGREQTMLSVGLALVDSGICWWIFNSLIQTTRTLRLRRNVIKLSLYRHFTNTLIFAVLASIVFMVWMTFSHRAVECLTDWKELWFDDGYWQLLFSIVLLVIMFLWRPTNNNQRYAFTPLLDAADDEDKEDLLQPQNDAFEGMKMRGSKAYTAPGREKEKGESTAEDDLKWVEETIPSSLGEAALPSLLDSDEEIMTVRFEQSKME
ncbi:transmembrane protein 87A-like [Ornithodoros turicata]|uniref:transmembrane protein 87A-like n=1 Tax=Ornithodoros turicata TaxID=34597 RepID=UPI003139ECE5